MSAASLTEDDDDLIAGIPATMPTGERAMEKAFPKGVPIYYRDYALGDGIIQHMPDGRRFEIELVDGETRVLREIGLKQD